MKMMEPLHIKKKNKNIRGKEIKKKNSENIVKWSGENIKMEYPVIHV